MVWGRNVPDSNMAAPMSSHDKCELNRVLELYSGVGGMHYALEGSFMFLLLFC